MRMDSVARSIGLSCGCLVALLTLGCGQGSYDELIRQQMTEVGTWSPYESQLGYAVKIPDGVSAEPTTDETSDLVKFEWKGHLFRIEGLKTDTPDLEAEAKKLTDYYVSQAYEAGNPQNVSIDRLSGKKMSFSNPEADDLQIQVINFRQGIVRLMVSAPPQAFQDRIAQQFFGSVQHKPVQRGRR
ncbi:MAG: hypothetical protein AAGF97_12540 [Planctomycetota bacterium]